MTRPLEDDYRSRVAYTRALEAYCDTLAQPVQEPLTSSPTISAYSIPVNDKPFADEILIQRAWQMDGTALWAVRLDDNCLNKQGQWEWEPMPSSRDDEFLARCRFDSAEAAIEAALKEHNFCSRCGKRTKDLTTIHTCTPPQENT